MLLKLEIEIPEIQVEAISQILKRIGFSEIRALSQDEAEAYNAQYGLEKIRESLSEQGFNPR
jgi:hypothetical protein